MKPLFKSPVSARTKALISVAASALCVLVVAPSAFGACSYTGATQVFKPWDDQHNYVLAPDGGFESDASGWSLAGGADVAPGNETAYLHAATDESSVSLPAGSTATSPPICVALDTPVLRAMTRNTGNPKSRLRVEVTYKLLGLVQTKVVTDMTSGSTWRPSSYISPTLGLSTIVGTLLPASVQVTFRPLDSTGNWQIDDFYVDPYSRR
ncbi:MAG: hypothetical protein QOI10_3013 [Solirubrobacterales bacterium]|nr:hypothetical protein [Solirubrobacterales bacterium]